MEDRFLILIPAVLLTAYFIFGLVAPEKFLKVRAYRGFIKGTPWNNSIEIRESSILITRIMSLIGILGVIGFTIWFLIISTPST